MHLHQYYFNANANVTHYFDGIAKPLFSAHLSCFSFCKFKLQG